MRWSPRGDVMPVPAMLTACDELPAYTPVCGDLIVYHSYNDNTSPTISREKAQEMRQNGDEIYCRIWREQ